TLDLCGPPVDVRAGLRRILLECSGRTKVGCGQRRQVAGAGDSNRNFQWIARCQVRTAYVHVHAEVADCTAEGRWRTGGKGLYVDRYGRRLEFERLDIPSKRKESVPRRTGVRGIRLRLDA